MASTKRSKAGPEPAMESNKYVEPIDRKNGPWDDYDIRSFLRTLTEANKIRGNAKLMQRIRAEAQKQVDVAKATAATIKR